MNKRVLLNRLYAEYAEDPAFRHMAVKVRGVVHGDGPTDPRLMFVGEAPGAYEDKQGKPFVGASGQFLNELLESVAIKRSEVFITNAVKYRPVTGRNTNRPPTEQERWNSVRYLRKEHAILGHPPIVILGKHARDVTAKLDGSYIKNIGDPADGMVVGEWFQMDGYWMLPLHHPAYGIYQRGNRPIMFEQFKAVLNPPKV